MLTISCLMVNVNTRSEQQPQVLRSNCNVLLLKRFFTDIYHFLIQNHNKILSLLLRLLFSCIVSLFQLMSSSVEVLYSHNMSRNIDDWLRTVPHFDVSNAPTEVASTISDDVTEVEHCEEHPAKLPADESPLPSHDSIADPSSPCSTRSLYSFPADRSVPPFDYIRTPTSSMSALVHLNKHGFDNADNPTPHSSPSHSSIVKMPSGFSMNQRPPFLDPMEGVGVQQYDVLKIKNVSARFGSCSYRSFDHSLPKMPSIPGHIGLASLYVLRYYKLSFRRS